jgi:MFS family permease
LTRLSLRPDLTPLRRSRDYRAAFISRTVAMFGSQAAEVALLVQAKQLTGSPLIVGLLGVAELVPLVVFGLYGGALADRFDRRALMRWCEPGLACCAGLLLLNGLLPHPAVWPLFVVSALMMALAALQRPAFEAAMPRMVPREQITAASALLSGSQNISVLLGSSLGGVLAVTPGPWVVYALDGAGFAVSFWLLSRLPKLPPEPATDAGSGSGSAPGSAAGSGSAPGSGSGSGSAPGSALREILVGIRYAVSRKDLLGSYLADLSAMIFAYPNALFPFMAVILHAPWATGLMFAVPSVGAFMVSATSGWMGQVRRHGLAIAISAALWGAAMAGFGLSPNIYVALGFLALAGAADETSGIFRDTLWKQTIPDHLRGRMAGIELLSYGAGPPTGQLRSGVVASLAGLRFSLVSGGVACVAAVGVVCAALPAFSRYAAAVPPPGDALEVTAPGDAGRVGAPVSGESCAEPR